ncbi:MAG: MFS transporter, partial [Gammaproteobacteria bacterium]|nr:MFS transporter [Gammaproteobacteria bacterium]
MVLAFALLHGFAWGVRGPLMGSIRADYFGRRAFGVIMGIANIFAMVGMIIGPLLVGVVVDRTDSYEGAFLLLAALGAAASSFFLLA